jgi:putative transposase
VSLQARREAVGILTDERGLGVTRACGLVGISRSLYRYRSRLPPALELRNRIAELAAQKRRYGYRRIQVLLRREGWSVNHKKTYRLYREQGLAVRKRKRKCQGQPKFPQLCKLNLPHPVQESFASSARTRPALSFSLSR